MEKAAEVYTRLKSRVLGPKIEAIQKATRAGLEKERAEVEKAEEVPAGEEASTERAEVEASAGEQGGTSLGLRRHLAPTPTAKVACFCMPGCVLKVAGAWCVHVSEPLIDAQSPTAWEAVYVCAGLVRERCWDRRGVGEHGCFPQGQWPWSLSNGRVVLPPRVM